MLELAWHITPTTYLCLPDPSSERLDSTLAWGYVFKAVTRRSNMILRLKTNKLVPNTIKHLVIRWFGLILCFTNLQSISRWFVPSGRMVQLAEVSKEDVLVMGGSCWSLAAKFHPCWVQDDFCGSVTWVFFPGPFCLQGSVWNVMVFHEVSMITMFHRVSCVSSFIAR